MSDDIGLGLYHGCPVLFYLLSALMFYRISRVRGTYWLWQVGWACFATSATFLSLTRGFNILTAFLPAEAGRWLPYQTAVVILASAMMFAGCLCVWHVFRAGGATR